MADETWVVIQGGIEVASVTGPRAFAASEIMHYANQYAQDGPVIVERRTTRRRKKAKP